MFMIRFPALRCKSISYGEGLGGWWVAQKNYREKTPPLALPWPLAIGGINLADTQSIILSFMNRPAGIRYEAPAGRVLEGYVTILVLVLHVELSVILTSHASLVSNPNARARPRAVFGINPLILLHYRPRTPAHLREVRPDMRNGFLFERNVFP